MILQSRFADVVIPEIHLGDYVMNSLSQHDQDATAIIDMLSGQSLTFKQIHDEAQRLTGLLWRAGLRKGDIVGMVLPFDMQFAPLYIAISCCGGVLFGCKLLFKSSIHNQLRSVKPTVVITTNDRYDEVSEDLKQEVPSVRLCISFDDINKIAAGSIRSRDNDMPCYGSIDVHNDAAAIFQSSGTTGQPKGIVITHHAVIANLTVSKSGGLNMLGNTGVVLNIFHVMSMSMLLSNLIRGTMLACASSITAEQHLEFTQKYKISSWVIGNVNYLKGMVLSSNEKYDLSSLQNIMVGGTTFPPDLIQQAREKFGISVCMGYGSTEMGSVSYGLSNKTPTNSVGQLVCNNQVKIIDGDKELGQDEKGEICVKSPQIMKEYFIADGKVAQGVVDGWMHSGDLGYFDKRGYLYVVGRIKEAIKIQPGNVTVMPAELEDLIRRHDKVDDVAVVGVSNPDHGEAPRAFVVRNDETLVEDEVIKFFEDQVEKVTSLHGGVEFVPVIPRTEIGKPKRLELLKFSTIN